MSEAFNLISKSCPTQKDDLLSRLVKNLNLASNSFKPNTHTFITVAVQYVN